NLQLSKMDKNEASMLKRAVQREKKARKAAENLLEQKAKELYDASLHLREASFLSILDNCKFDLCSVFI
ncbi:MAG: hypothetical protein AAFY00_13875, partial [Bacteroidota bacterium]